MIAQLNPPLPVWVKDKGNGLAHALIDYGAEHSLIFVVFLDSNGECWCIRNEDVRARWNSTMGRVKP